MKQGGNPEASSRKNQLSLTETSGSFQNRTPRSGIWILKLPEVSRIGPRAGILFLKLPEDSRNSWNLEPETSGSFQKHTPCWNMEPETSGSFQNAVSGNLKFEFVDKGDGGSGDCKLPPSVRGRPSPPTHPPPIRSLPCNLSGEIPASLPNMMHDPRNHSKDG